MDPIKTEIKEEVSSSEVIYLTERESSSQDITVNLNSDPAISTKVCEIKIKEEVIDAEFTPQNDCQCSSENLIMKAQQFRNDEMATETEVNKACVDSIFCSQNKTQLVCKVPALAVSPCNQNSELDIKKEIKEELWWLETTSTDAPCMEDITKDSVDESCPLTESERLYREASRDKSDSFCKDNSGNNARVNRIKDSSECENATKYTSKETELPGTSSAKEHYCSESDMVRGHKCNICGKCFTRMSDLNRHKLIHEGIKPYKCDICGKCFTRLSVLNRHKLVHEGIKPHKCDICGKCFIQMQQFKNHKFAHEGIKPHKCEACGKSFMTLNTLKTHKLIHEGIKPHRCDTCGKCFTWYTYLKRHILTHEGIKRHKCDTCGKCFTDMTHLKQHILIHEGIKPHKCDTCGKCFIRLSELKNHHLTHEGIKPHKCDICGKCFTLLSVLKTHKLTHDGIKSYKCDTCGKCFTQMPHLKSHKLSHEGIKPHKCDKCEKSFTHMSTLKRHKLTHEATQM